MTGKVTPRRLPFPRTMLGHDGTDFHAIKVGADGGPIVRGEDQLFSFKSTLLSVRNHAISDADGYSDSHIVPAGEVWVVTSVSVIDMTSPTTEVIIQIRRGASNYYFHEEEAYKSAGRAWTVQCAKHLTVDDLVRVYFIGGLAGDECWITLTGHRMTKES